MSISAHEYLKKEGDADAINGPWKLSLDIPTYTAFMTYANDRNLRETLYKAFVSRASHGEKITLKLLRRFYLLGLNRLSFLVMKAGQN